MTASASGLPLEFVVFGVPASAQTKNMARKQVWTDAVTAAARTAWAGDLLDIKVRVVITYYERGGRLPDVDNMAKPILDAITGTIWVDDIQVDRCNTGRTDLDGRYRVAGISMVLAEGFTRDEPFVHVQIIEFTDQELLP